MDEELIYIVDCSFLRGNRNGNAPDVVTNDFKIDFFYKTFCCVGGDFETWKLAAKHFSTTVTSRNPNTVICHCLKHSWWQLKHYKLNHELKKYLVDTLNTSS